MNIEFSVLLTIVSVGAAVLFGLSNYNRNARKDAEEDGKILQELENIRDTVDKTDKKIDKITDDANDLRERLIGLEKDKEQQMRSLQRAHERIDELKKQIMS